MNSHLSKYAGPRIRPDRSQLVSFYDESREWRFRARVPDARHVATRLALPVLADVGITHRPVDRSRVAQTLQALLSELPRPHTFYNPGEAYKGLWGALSLPLHADDVSGFDRGAYIDAIVDAAMRELRVARTLSPAGVRPAPMTAGQRKALLAARNASRERSLVLSVLRREVNDLALGDAIDRAELVDMVVEESDDARNEWERLRDVRLDAEEKHRNELESWHVDAESWTGAPSQRPRRPRREATPTTETWAGGRADDFGLDPDVTPVRIGPRRAATLLAELAPSVGLAETRSGNARRFTLRTPEEPAVTLTETLREETAAIEANIDARERWIAALKDSQDAYLAAGDPTSALRAQSERLAATTTAAAVTDLSAWRARRAS